ncbi:PilZ domain-containing protein [Plasticicumulans acidivorans]|uniref:Cyclic diguanosine monophosphate-binding protein n=1 Tax=Plasticicumulans acidivorans TaxID=886464 RepID=A0A317MZL4_9GAMM|nr:PilZ domain-containing protein [Plasticicumulans acidivorans]PWV65742.1 PilZ domain-containing protein [Plasticicumulans acidivorans]
MSEERRIYSRIPFVAHARLEVDGTVHEVELLDLSLKGALLQFSGTAPAPGSGMRMQLALDPAEEIVLAMHGILVHTEGDRLGLHFDAVDIDTMTHLRRLMEFNLGDPERIRREVHEMVQIVS